MGNIVFVIQESANGFKWLMKHVDIPRSKLMLPGVANRLVFQSSKHDWIIQYRGRSLREVKRVRLCVIRK